MDYPVAGNNDPVENVVLYHTFYRKFEPIPESHDDLPAKD
jgi:hypothetical protein